MPATTTNLFLLQDLEDGSLMGQLAQSDLKALHTVADWIKTFVARPNKDLSRAGPVCPFVPAAWERKNLWLAPEQIANRSVQDVVQLVNGYKSLFLSAHLLEGDDANYKAIVVVFTDTATQQEVWRGFITGTIDAKHLDKDVNNSIAKLVKRFVKDQARKA